MSNDLLLLSVLAGVIAGAFVASRNGEPAWKGGAIILGGFALAYAVITLFQVEAMWWPIVLQMLGSGLVGGALRVKNNLIVGIFVISVLAQVAIGVAAAFLMGA